MSVRDISTHLSELYGTEIGRDTISRITDAVQAVMSDNAKCFATSFEFRDTLAELGARHILIPPRTPRWNGKIERFFGTLDREWAHGRI
jgi:transposase InsO family protein